MQFFPVGRVFNFMRVWRQFASVSLLLVVGSIVLLIVPGPKLGTDFRGGTEVEVAFNQAVEEEAIRDAVAKKGFLSPDVIRITDGGKPNQVLIRVQEVSAIGEADQAQIERALCFGENLDPSACPDGKQATEVKFSPGGEKITVRFDGAPDLVGLKKTVSSLSAISLRDGENNPHIQDERDHKVEILLKSKGDELMDALREGLGAGVVPDVAERVEWIGPKAGAQLRDSALKAMALALVFIMVYIAVRFDLRFAPGSILALIHDGLGTVGIMIVLGKELNLATVAAVLTIIGFSINDTVVVYDRVRENLAKHRGTSFKKIVNLSLSEMLGRTILTNGTAVLSMLAFFFWGTGALKDFALAIVIGILLGTYSSIYVALPFTELLDRTIFANVGKKPAGPGQAKKDKKQTAYV